MRNNNIADIVKVSLCPHVYFFKFDIKEFAQQKNKVTVHHKMLYTICTSEIYEV